MPARSIATLSHRFLSVMSTIALFSFLAAAQARLEAQTCPAVGADSTCGTVITVTDAGATVMATGQGPYDGFDDTLVGVINNSSTPIHALLLKSANDIFGFDGDGIVTYGIAGNAQDNTGYGGPNAYFSDIDPSYASGIVHFIVPIAPGGGTAFFSLENALNLAYSCQDVVNGGLTSPPPGPLGSPNIMLSFKPNLGLTLQQAAPFCGFVNFDWVQQVTHQDDPSAFYARNTGGAFKASIVGPVNLSSATTPYSDPPQGGGYTYTTSPDNSYPFYYNAYTSELQNQEAGGYVLSFLDAPSDPCLPGGGKAGTAACQNMTEPAGSAGGYTNHLAGVNADGTATNLGMGVDYISNYNGTTGGVYVKKTLVPADGNGTGGITITNVVPNTTYSYQGFTVSAINPPGSGSSFVYVADSQRVQKFTSTGQFVSQFSILGGGGFIFGPGGIAVDSSGDVFLSDTYNKSVVEFDTTGHVVKSFGSYGTGSGQFLNGMGAIALDTMGRTYVTDGGNNRVQVFDSNGNYVTQLGMAGKGPGQFNNPSAVAVDGSGMVYVADSTRVQKFTSAGVFSSQFTIMTGGRFQYGAAGLAVDSTGETFLTDTFGKAVSKYDATGSYAGTYGGFGSGNGQFQNSIGPLSVDSSGLLWVADSGSERVQQLDGGGTFQLQIGGAGSGPGQFQGAVFVATAPN